MSHIKGSGYGGSVFDTKRADQWLTGNTHDVLSATTITGGTVLGVDFSDVANTGHTHTESDITDLGDYAERTHFESHTGDSTVHFQKTDIDFSDIQNTAHTHSQYLVNNADDSTTGRLTADGGFESIFSTTLLPSAPAVVRENGCFETHAYISSSPHVFGHNLTNVCNNMSLTGDVGSFINTSEVYVGYDGQLNLTDLGTSFNNSAVYAMRYVVDAQNSWKMNNSPFYFEFKNPKSTESWSQYGAFFVKLEGADSGDHVAAWTQADVGGTANGIGYKGYSTQRTGGAHTGELVGVQGWAVDAAGSNSSAQIGLEGIIAGGNVTSRSKKMGLRTNAHAVIKGFGNLYIEDVTSPALASFDKLSSPTGGTGGDIYVSRDAEIDGELFVDGNISHSATAVTGNYTISNVVTVFADASSGALSVTLPTGTLGRKHTIKKTDSSSNAVTIVGTVDGVTNPTIIFQYDAVDLQFTGSEWGIT